MSASQNEAILAALMSGKSLTALDALRDHSCFRLAARVFDLRKAGHHIEEEIVSHNGKRYARYFMPVAVNQGELCFS